MQQIFTGSYILRQLGLGRYRRERSQRSARLRVARFFDHAVAVTLASNDEPAIGTCETRRRLSETTAARNITARVLGRELKTLVKMGLLQRQELQSRPLKVQYGLTPEGRTLVPIIAVMHKWGVERA